MIDVIYKKEAFFFRELPLGQTERANSFIQTIFTIETLVVELELITNELTQFMNNSNHQDDYDFYQSEKMKWKMVLDT